MNRPQEDLCHGQDAYVPLPQDSDVIQALILFQGTEGVGAALKAGPKFDIMFFIC
jgi:hypothetical protein